MDNELIFRPLKHGDAEIIYDIVKDTGVFNPDEERIARDLALSTLAGTDCYSFILAELDGSAAGYVCYGEIPCTKGSYDIYWIAVLKEAQGLKIGKRLLAAAERDITLRGGRQTFISTSDSPPYSKTRLFYVNCGYKKAAVLKDYFAVGDDEAIYQKNLVTVH